MLHRDIFRSLETHLLSFDNLQVTPLIYIMKSYRYISRNNLIRSTGTPDIFAYVTAPIFRCLFHIGTHTICQVGIRCHVAIRAKYHGLNIKSLLRATKNGTWMSDQSRAALLRRESRRPYSLVFLEDRIENSYQLTENWHGYIKYWAWYIKYWILNSLQYFTLNID